MKEPGKTIEKYFSVMEICDLPGKEFKVMVIKMLPKLVIRIDDHSENLNKEIEKYKKVATRSHRAEEYKTCTEKYTRGFNSILNEAEERQGSGTLPIRAAKRKKK